MASIYNITYLFGAGASYNAVPIVKEMPAALSQLSEILDSTSVENSGVKYNSETKVAFGELKNGLNDLVRYSGEGSTIDNVARTFSHQGKTKELLRLKATLSVFFVLWQEWKGRRDMVVGTGNSAMLFSKPFVDPRYLNLFNNFIEKDKSSKNRIPQNINFLTWNYDVQIKKSLNLISGFNHLSEVSEHWGIYPNLRGSFLPANTNVVHLNGIAGLYEIPNGVKPESLFNRMENKEEFYHSLSEIIFVFDSISKGEIDIDATFSFAWENKYISQTALELSLDIMSKTNVLIVVGYSFPDFNAHIDRQLLKALQGNGRNALIYYQDLNPQINRLTRNLGFLKERVLSETNVDEFYLPTQYL